MQRIQSGGVIRVPATPAFTSDRLGVSSTTGEGEEPVDTEAPVSKALLGSGRLIPKRPRG